MLLLKEIITHYWAYTEQVNVPVVLLSPRSMGGKRGVGETAPFEEYNKTKSDVNNANVGTVRLRNCKRSSSSLPRGKAQQI